MKNLKSLFTLKKDINNKNINKKSRNSYIIQNITCHKKNQIDTFRNIKLSSSISIEDTDNKNNIKNLFIRRAFSNKTKSFFHRNKYKEGNSIMSQKTKTTFYNTKFKKDKIYPLTPRNEIKDLIDFNNEDLKDAKDAYEELKLLSAKNKDLILDKIEQYLESKGYNVEQIKNSISKNQIFNFLGKIKNIIMKYDCISNVSELYSHMGKKLSENTFLNLKKIYKIDKEISSAENDFYLSLLKK